MRIVFSRKGFDSTAGGGPSPIVDGAPISLPIPDTKCLSRTTYGDLRLGEEARAASRGRHGSDSLCHHDPMFLPDGTAMLGQVGAAQGHLAKQGVGIGDVFLFFGLFVGRDNERHHRLFGWLRVEAVVDLAITGPGTEPGNCWFDAACEADHPHTIGMHGKNDTIYAGPGGVATAASEALRLTVPGGPVALWQRPSWLQRGEISYFADTDANWPAPDRMYRVGNGQEFVADIGDREEPRLWLDRILADMAR